MNTKGETDEQNELMLYDKKHKQASSRSKTLHEPTAARETSRGRGHTGHTQHLTSDSMDTWYRYTSESVRQRVSYISNWMQASHTVLNDTVR